MGILSDIAKFPKIYNLGDPLRTYIQEQAASGIPSLGIVPLVFPTFLMNPIAYPSRTIRKIYRSRGYAASATLTATTRATIFEVEGIGTIQRIRLDAQNTQYIELYADDQILGTINRSSLNPTSRLTIYNLNSTGHDANSPDVQVLNYAAAPTVNSLAINIPLFFEEKFHIDLYNPDASDRVYWIGVTYTLQE